MQNLDHSYLQYLVPMTMCLLARNSAVSFHFLQVFALAHLSVNGPGVAALDP